MIRAALVLAWLLAGPGALWAASAADDAPDETADEAAAEGSGLPRSMQAHGVIGHLPSMGDYNLLDPAILTRMRAALVELAPGGPE